MKIAIKAIEPDPKQPRRKFDPAALRELAASIRENGLIQPITVRRRGTANSFVLVAGERRWRAHRILVDGGDRRFGMIAANVVAGDDAAAILVAHIVENVQRADMDPFEEADAMARLRDDHGMTPAEIAQRLGVVGFRVEWRLRLLQLAPELRRLAEAEQIDRQTAMEVARLSPARQPS